MMVHHGPEPVVVRRFQTARLHAQDGLFTLVRGSAATQPLDAMFDSLCSDELYRTYRPTLRKITPPTTAAGKLLRLLSYEHVTAASIYPDYAGVVRAMKEEALWDLPGNTSERSPGWRPRPGEAHGLP